MTTEKKAKKLTLAELAEKHGIPNFTTVQSEAILSVPFGGDYRQREGSLSPYIIRKLVRLGAIEPSKNMHATCGSILWTLTHKGLDWQTRIKSMQEEIATQKQNGRPLRAA